MQSDLEKASVRFHDRARVHFFSLYSDFKQATRGLDRTRDENVFQQVRCKYTAQLKLQLSTIAIELLSQSSTGTDATEWKHVFGGFTEEYIREFGHKVSLL